jgi:hypothetical protein
MPALIRRTGDHRYGLRWTCTGVSGCVRRWAGHAKLDQTPAARDLMPLVTERGDPRGDGGGGEICHPGLPEFAEW